MSLQNERCPFCLDAVDPLDRFVWQKVVGWEQRRQQGGTNHIALREPRDQWAHAHCVRLARQGHLGQERLAI